VTNPPIPIKAKETERTLDPHFKPSNTKATFIYKLYNAKTILEKITSFYNKTRLNFNYLMLYI